jgi:hypothetical protein
VIWLIRLYPPSWRRRYGQELAEFLEAEPASFATAVDLVAGAVDAWLNPQSSTVATAGSKGDKAMIAKLLQLRYTGNGADYTGADALKAAAVTIFGTLAMVLTLTWAMRHFGKNDFLTAFMGVAWVFPFLLSQRYTDLKGRSGKVQAVLIGGPTLLVFVIVWSAAWINNG